MRSLKTICTILLVAVAFSGCVTATTTPQKSQLQIRQFQTRTFETSDEKGVMKALLNVLQDDGYIVKNANTDLGLLVAVKEIDITNSGEAVLLTLLAGSNARYQKNAIIEASANVSKIGKKCKVRVNFQKKIFNNKGEVMEVIQVTDQKYYQNFFSKVDKGIFLHKQKL